MWRKVINQPQGRSQRKHDKVQAHEAPVFAFVSLCNLARMSVWQSESTASLASVLSCTTMYSIYSGREMSGQEMKASKTEYLVAPHKLIAVPILKAVPCTQKLGDAMSPYVLRKVLCFVPG